MRITGEIKTRLKAGESFFVLWRDLHPRYPQLHLHQVVIWWLEVRRR